MNRSQYVQKINYILLSLIAFLRYYTKIKVQVTYTETIQS